MSTRTVSQDPEAGGKLATAGARLFGKSWKPKLAAALGKRTFTVHRYTTGELKVPIETQWALYGLAACKRHDRRGWKRVAAAEGAA